MATDRCIDSWLQRGINNTHIIYINRTDLTTIKQKNEDDFDLVTHCFLQLEVQRSKRYLQVSSRQLPPSQSAMGLRIVCPRRADQTESAKEELKRLEHLNCNDGLHHKLLLQFT